MQLTRLAHTPQLHSATLPTLLQYFVLNILDFVHLRFSRLITCRTIAYPAARAQTPTTVVHRVRPKYLNSAMIVLACPRSAGRKDTYPIAPRLKGLALLG